MMEENIVNKTLFVIALLLVILLVLSFAVYANVSTSSTRSEYKLVSSSYDNEKFDKLSIKLEKPSKTASIAPDVAVESAKNAYKDLDKEATEISVEYVAMTNDYGMFSEKALEKNPKLKKDKCLKALPVYIVCFKDIESIIPFGGVHIVPESGIKTKSISEVNVKTEANVVVDAESGETLFLFSYK